MATERPILAPESFADLSFPLQGIDRSVGYMMQRQGTTPVGNNVRAYEPLSGRAKGGNRPGIVPWIPATVNGVHLIQHLNVIIDPSADALTDSFDVLGGGVGSSDYTGPLPALPGGFVFDTSNYDSLPGIVYPFTRNPGRIIRDGGSGIQPNKNARPRAKGTTAIGFAVAWAASNPPFSPWAFSVTLNGFSLGSYSFTGPAPLNGRYLEAAADPGLLGFRWAVTTLEKSLVFSEQLLLAGTNANTLTVTTGSGLNDAELIVRRFKQKNGMWDLVQADTVLLVQAFGDLLGGPITGHFTT